jgi:dimethylhistidine N-methyltransferase
MTPPHGSASSIELPPAAAARERFRADVLSGLAATPKRLVPKYFYDRTGSLLFDAICDLDEYYLTRAELSIMRARATEIADACAGGQRVRVVEPGAGSGTKTRLLLRALGTERCTEYVPVDIAKEHLTEAAARIRAEIPWLRVSAVAADFATDLPIGVSDDATRTIVYFPGSTLGNFDPPDAERLLARFRRVAGDGGAIVLGVDLKKDPNVLHAAYNDARGVTAAFNRNVLVRINRELEGDFVLDAFAHYAFYAPLEGRMEMHLVSTRRQEVVVSGHRFAFAEGESIHTECSYKYDLQQVERLARAARLELTESWLDDERRFAVLLLRPVAIG